MTHSGCCPAFVAVTVAVSLAGTVTLFSEAVCLFSIHCALLSATLNASRLPSLTVKIKYGVSLGPNKLIYIPS